MIKRSIAKPAPPEIVKYSHFSADLNWKDQYEKVSIGQNCKVLSEISMIGDKSQEGWKNVYIGYASNFTPINLEDSTKYAFRIRYKINEEWSPFSEPVVMESLEKPMTGEHIHKAIRSSDIKELNRVLEDGKVNIEAQDGLGFTPLMVAAQSNLIEIMKLLFRKRADIEAKTDSGKTVLMLVCFKGVWEAIELLINYGANLNNTDRSNFTALHYAVDGESTRSIKILGIAGAPVDPTDSVLGWTPLMRCAGLKTNGNIDVAKELIKFGANVNRQDKEGNTALHLSVINGHTQLFEVLLNAGADPNIYNKLKNSVVKLVDSTDNMAMKQLVQQFIKR